MIVVRNVFRLKFGKARDAVALWQEGMEMMRRKGRFRETRLMTDVASDFYTLVFENSYDSLADLEREMQSTMADPDWKAMYQRFVPLAESGYREIFTLVGSSAPSLGGAESRERAAAGSG
ncbi:MAG: NIPSNAP family protein [Gemmatimonadaceae bacterium]